MNVKGGTWKEYKKRRKQVLNFLNGEYNKAKHEAIFDEDYERLENLKIALGFISAFDSNKYLDFCPMCGARLFLHAEVNNVSFDNETFNTYPQYHLPRTYDKLTINKCEKCGWYTIDEF